jgi:hypothetical protein
VNWTVNGASPLVTLEAKSAVRAPSSAKTEDVSMMKNPTDKTMKNMPDGLIYNDSRSTTDD